MKILESPQEVLKRLENSESYKKWHENHKNSILSHFFCSLSSELKVKENWDIGFYDNDSKKIIIFSTKENSFEIKPEDDVFKKENEKIEALDLSDVEITIDEAASAFKEVSKEFSKEVLGDGFLILQKLNNISMWNFTFITRSLKFANVKINATDAKTVSTDLVSVVSQ